jgi:biopolymer transport protein ExbD
MPLKIKPAEEPQLNLTPMIDVILTLIIFFMVATKFTEEERSIDLKLPSPEQAAQANTAQVPQFINIQNDGSIYLGKEPVSLDELSKRLIALRSKSSKIQVVVRGDQLTPHGRMAEVYAAVRAAGVPDLGIALKLPPTNKK